jgi:exodeoxyribonuclease VII large subunit
MDFFSLSQLNGMVMETVKDTFPETCWVLAETADVKIQRTGHCYLEFIEKHPDNNSTVAKARGYIWANIFASLRMYFEQQTGRRFESGLKVLVQVAVEFHPVYGYGLNVCGIDPSYTVGDLQAQKQKILRKLGEEGILTMNRELELPVLPQRIAVISSETAAGYGDFVRHIESSEFVFYPRLFPAIMQGEHTEKSIIAALNKIFSYSDLFDAVVIIRGGGASSDLASFDTYDLAANCAQFPLPIITGIGHERDDTVLDTVAFHSAKTPTAVADYLIGVVQNVFETLSNIAVALPTAARRLIENSASRLEMRRTEICNSAQKMIDKNDSYLREKEVFFKLSSPEYILAKGYSITVRNGKALKSIEGLQPNDIVETILADGKFTGRIVAKSPEKYVSLPA